MAADNNFPITIAILAIVLCVVSALLFVVSVCLYLSSINASKGRKMKNEHSWVSIVPTRVVVRPKDGAGLAADVEISRDGLSLSFKDDVGNVLVIDCDADEFIGRCVAALEIWRAERRQELA